MLRSLQDAIKSLLIGKLPSLFEGETSPAAISFVESSYEVDPLSADATAGEPAPEDASDTFAFNPSSPSGPYTLNNSPYAGPKRVYLCTPENDRYALANEEVTWNNTDPRLFTITPKASRIITGLDHVFVMYGVVSVHSKMKIHGSVTLELTGRDSNGVEKTEALAFAVLTIHRNDLIASARISYSADNYGFSSEVKTFKFIKGLAPSSNSIQIHCYAELEITVRRALEENEGEPIRRIVSPGVTDNDKKIDIRVGLDG